MFSRFRMIPILLLPLWTERRRAEASVFPVLCGSSTQVQCEQSARELKQACSLCSVVVAHRYSVQPVCLPVDRCKEQGSAHTEGRGAAAHVLFISSGWLINYRVHYVDMKADPSAPQGLIRVWQAAPTAPLLSSPLPLILLSSPCILNNLKCASIACGTHKPNRDY